MANSKKKHLWHNPEVHARFHLVMLLLWIILIVPSILWLRESIFWLVFMSVYAIIVSHFSSYEATRSELIAKKQIEGEFDELQKGETLEELEDRKDKNT